MPVAAAIADSDTPRSLGRISVLKTAPSTSVPPCVTSYAASSRLRWLIVALRFLAILSPRERS
jgi:hypothetical protein